MGNLSIETSEGEVEDFCNAFDEFLATRGELVRTALG
jgi:hypothetical protein